MSVRRSIAFTAATLCAVSVALASQPATALAVIELPLRVHLIESTVHDLDASFVEDHHITDRLTHLNKMFAPAAIQWKLDRIQRDRPADTKPFERAVAGEKKQRSLPALVRGADLLTPNGFDLYVVRNLNDIDLGGAFRCHVTADLAGPSAAFIAAHDARGGAQPLRKWAHELGHALSLAHTPCESKYADNLMMSGRCEQAHPKRIALDASQIERARIQATTGHPATCEKAKGK